MERFGTVPLKRKIKESNSTRPKKKARINIDWSRRAYCNIRCFYFVPFFLLLMIPVLTAFLFRSCDKVLEISLV